MKKKVAPVCGRAREIHRIQKRSRKEYKSNPLARKKGRIGVGHRLGIKDLLERMQKTRGRAQIGGKRCLEEHRQD